MNRFPLLTFNTITIIVQTVDRDGAEPPGEDEYENIEIPTVFVSIDGDDSVGDAAARSCTGRVDG